MLRKIIVPCSFFLLIGCTTNDVIQHEQNQLLKPTKDEFHEQLGYVHYTKEQIENEAEEQPTTSINEKERANIISRFILQNEGFDEVATLVSQMDVLIAFKHNEKLDEAMARDLAKKAAGSILPRNVNIYVSSNPAFIPYINSLHNSQISSTSFQQTIDFIKREMEKK